MSSAFQNLGRDRASSTDGWDTAVGIPSSETNRKSKDIRNSSAAAKEPFWKLWSHASNQKSPEDTKPGQLAVVISGEERGASMDHPGRIQHTVNRPEQRRSNSISNSHRSNANTLRVSEYDGASEDKRGVRTRRSINFNAESGGMRPPDSLNVNNGADLVRKPMLGAQQQVKPTKLTSRRPVETSNVYPKQLSGRETTAQLQQMLDDLARTHKLQVDDLERSHESFVKQLQDEHLLQKTAERQQHQREISCFAAEVESLSTKTGREKNMYDTALEELRRSHEVATNEQLQDHHRTIAEFEAHRMTERSDLMRAHQAEISSLNEIIRKARSEAETVNALNKQHTMNTEQYRHAHQNEVFKLSTELAEVRSAVERQLGELTEAHRREISELKERHEAELSQRNEAEVRDAVEQQVSELKALHKKEISELKERHEAEFLQGIEASAQRLQEQEDEHQETLLERCKEIEQFKHTYDEKMEDVKRNHAAEISQLTETFEANEKQAMSVLDKEKLHLRAQIQDLTAALSERDQELSMSLLLSSPPTKTDDNLKNDFLKVQRVVEEIGCSEWRQDDEINNLLESADGELDQRKLKRAVLQHIVWGQLSQFVLTSPFRVFGEEGLNLEKEWAAYCGQAESFSDNQNAWPSVSHRNEKWRSMTMAGCREVLISPLSQYDPRAQLKKGFRESLDSLVATLKSELGVFVDLESQENTSKLIERLPKKAAALWVDFAAQRCRIMIRPSSTSTSTLSPAALLETGAVLNLRPELGRYGEVEGADLDTFTPIEGCEAQTLEIEGDSLEAQSVVSMDS